MPAPCRIPPHVPASRPATRTMRVKRSPHRVRTVYYHAMHVPAPHTRAHARIFGCTVHTQTHMFSHTAPHLAGKRSPLAVHVQAKGRQARRGWPVDRPHPLLAADWPRATPGRRDDPHHVSQRRPACGCRGQCRLSRGTGGWGACRLFFPATRFSAVVVAALRARVRVCCCMCKCVLSVRVYVSCVYDVCVCAKHAIYMCYAGLIFPL